MGLSFYFLPVFFLPFFAGREDEFAEFSELFGIVDSAVELGRVVLEL